MLAAGSNPDQSIGNRIAPASIERPDEKEPLSALLGHGAVIERANAVAKALDFDNLEGLKMIRAHRKEPPRAGSVLWAIWRRRSAAHVRTLLAHGLPGATVP